MGFRAPNYRALMGEWWRPDEIGEVMEGVFLGEDSAPSNFGKGDQTFYGIQTDDNTQHRISANALLAKALDDAKVRIGDRVLIEYSGIRGRARDFTAKKMALSKKQKSEPS